MTNGIITKNDIRPGSYIITKFDKDLVLCVMEMHGDLIYRAKEKETGERWDNIHIEEVVKIVKRECDE